VNICTTSSSVFFSYAAVLSLFIPKYKIGIQEEENRSKNPQFASAILIKAAALFRWNTEKEKSFSVRKIKFIQPL